jgi:hypothetical protein
VDTRRSCTVRSLQVAMAWWITRPRPGHLAAHGPDCATELNLCSDRKFQPPLLPVLGIWANVPGTCHGRRIRMSHLENVKLQGYTRDRGCWLFHLGAAGVRLCGRLVVSAKWRSAFSSTGLFIPSHEISVNITTPSDVSSLPSLFFRAGVA